MTSTRPPGSPRGGRAAVVYTLLRVLLFLGCTVAGWLAGLRGLLLLVVALVTSGLLSWFVLARQRVAMSGAVEGAVGRMRERQRRRTSAEDAYVDRMIAEQGDMTRPDR